MFDVFENQQKVRKRNIWSLRELWNGNSRPRKYLNFFPLSLPSSLPSSLLRCIAFPHHPSILLWIRLPLQKKNFSRRVLEKWKWYTDCAVGNTLKTYDIWIKTIPISPPTCAIDHHCEVHGSSVPSEGADLFKHVRLLVVSSAENLHLVKSSTQPGWGLTFPRKSFKTKINTHLIHCEPIIFWRLKKKTETTESTHQQLFAESLLHISNQSEFVHEERTATAGHGLDRHFDGVAHAGHLFHSGGVRHSGPSNGKGTFTSSGYWANPLRITYQSASQHI